MRAKKRTRIILYFTFWLVFAVLCGVLNVINIDWDQTGTFGGISFVTTLTILQGSVLEFPLQAIVTLLIGGKVRKNKKAPCDHLSVILNYNLLATSKEEIDDCMENMYKAYIGNLSPQIATVLVSATNKQELKLYEIQVRDRIRRRLYIDLYLEGIAFSRGDYDAIDSIHFQNIWEKYLKVDKDRFLSEILENVCEKLTKNFMVLHRVSRVLRKCGQYQDLMLLSEGINEAFSYCDRNYYGKLARNMGEPLFHDGDDLNNICGRKFDYTLVLDSDTCVSRGIVFEIMQIAAAHPKRAIIQPAIKLYCTKFDSIFMRLECIRQSIFEPMTNASMALLQQCSFFGKGLIKNKLYIEIVIGTKDRPIERVPVDVLSHDTFEASILKPLYAGSVFLLEEPCHNFVTWNMRERRWNKGEVITTMYIRNRVFGMPMRCLQKLFQRSKYNKVKLRTKTKLDFVTSHIAHSAFRHMLMKPVLVILILCHLVFKVIFKNVYISITIVMFLVLIFPKIATCSRHNYKYVVIETISSLLQFTPEVIVGTVRLFRAIYANISLNTKWTPQRTVEDNFKTQNCFWLSIKELWGYSLFALISTVLIILLLETTIIALIMTSIIFLLPLFSGFTALSLATFRRNKMVKPTQNNSNNNKNFNIMTNKHIWLSMFGSVHSKDIVPTHRPNALHVFGSQLKSELTSNKNPKKSSVNRISTIQTFFQPPTLENLEDISKTELPIATSNPKNTKDLLSESVESGTDYSLYNGTEIRNVSLDSLRQSLSSTITTCRDLEHLIDNTYEFGKNTLIGGSFTKRHVHTNGTLSESNHSSTEFMLPLYEQKEIDVYEIYNISSNASQSLNSQMSLETLMTSNASSNDKQRVSYEKQYSNGKIKQTNRDEILSHQEPDRENAVNIGRSHIKSEFSSNKKLKRCSLNSIGTFQPKKLENSNGASVNELPLVTGHHNHREYLQSKRMKSTKEYSLYNGTQIRNIRLDSLTPSLSTKITTCRDLEHLIDNTNEFGKNTLIATTRHVQTNGTLFESNQISAEIMLPRYERTEIEVCEVYDISSNANQSPTSQMSLESLMTSNASKRSSSVTPGYEKHYSKGKIKQTNKHQNLSHQEAGLENALRSHIKSEICSNKKLKKSSLNRISNFQTLFQPKRVVKTNITSIIELPIATSNYNNRIHLQSKRIDSEEEYSLYNGTQIRNIHLDSLTRSLSTTITTCRNLEHLIDNTYELGKNTLIATRRHDLTLGNLFESNQISAGILLPRYKRTEIDVCDLSANANQLLNSRRTLETSITSNASKRSPSLTPMSENHYSNGKVKQTNTDQILSHREPDQDKIFYIPTETGNCGIFDKINVVS